MYRKNKIQISYICETKEQCNKVYDFLRRPIHKAAVISEKRGEQLVTNDKDIRFYTLDNYKSREGNVLLHVENTIHTPFAATHPNVKKIVNFKFLKK